MAKSTGATTDGIARLTQRIKKLEATDRTLTAGSPLKSASIGTGGLRVYDAGRILLDGSELQISLEIREGQGFIRYMPVDRAGLRADPAFWGNEDLFVVAGPLRDESTGGEGYGGSNLFLYPTSGELWAGTGGATPARVIVRDNGTAGIYAPNGSWEVMAGGSQYFNAVNSGIQLHADGAWQVGGSGRAIFQGAAGGTLNLFGNAFNVNTDLTVSGAKNFIMEHPEKPDTLIRYGATESPVSAIECRGRVTLGEDGTAPVELPDHFTAIVKPGTDVDVWLQAYGPDPAWCEPPTATGATVHGPPGTVVAWTATAERIGGDFLVEEPGSLPTPSLAPPEPESEEPSWPQP